MISTWTQILTAAHILGKRIDIEITPVLTYHICDHYIQNKSS